MVRKSVRVYCSADHSSHQVEDDGDVRYRDVGEVPIPLGYTYVRHSNRVTNNVPRRNHDNHHRNSFVRRASDPKILAVRLHVDVAPPAQFGSGTSRGVKMTVVMESADPSSSNLAVDEGQSAPGSDFEVVEELLEVEANTEEIAPTYISRETPGISTTRAQAAPDVLVEGPASISQGQDICGLLRFLDENNDVSTYEEIASGCLTVYLTDCKGEAEAWREYNCSEGNFLNVEGCHAFSCSCS